MTRLGKLGWTLGVLAALLMIFISGRSNVHHSKQIQAAIETLYADRLVVKGLIFDLVSLVHEKELALARRDLDGLASGSKGSHAEFGRLLAAFRGTLLVPSEKEALDRFEETLGRLRDEEDALAAGAGATEDVVHRLQQHIDSLERDLEILARIQMDEGRRQLALGDRAVEDMDRFVLVETYMFLVVAALSIALIVFLPTRTRAH